MGRRPSCTSGHCYLRRPALSCDSVQWNGNKITVAVSSVSSSSVMSSLRSLVRAHSQPLCPPTRGSAVARPASRSALAVSSILLHESWLCTAHFHGAIARAGSAACTENQSTDRRDWARSLWPAAARKAHAWRSESGFEPARIRCCGRSDARPPALAPGCAVLGVDDWALRRGQRYGTILVDLDQHRVVDLLPERSSEAFAAWLRSHPEVEVVSRDRGDYYIKGAQAGAPQALQVADRWHLVHNLQEALVRLIERFGKPLKEAAKLLSGQQESATTKSWLRRMFHGGSSQNR